jgi:hypothetical protein
MPDAEIPKVRIRKEAEIPPVDPEGMKRMRNLKPPHSFENMQAACGPGADISAVLSRDGMIGMLTHLKLLTPWQHGEELDDVFRVAATFPMRVFKHKAYKIAWDDIFPFDPNAFVQRLIEETGISHVWEPIPTKIRGRFSYSTVSATLRGQAQGPPDPQREAKHQARQLLWDIWSRFANLDRLLSHSDEQAVSDKEAFHLVTMLFDDFVADSHDLLPEVESAFRSGDGMPPLTVLTELERRAQGRT